jgi:hypothetical protein
MWLRQWWPVLVTAPLLALPIIDWHYRSVVLEHSTEVIGRTVSVTEATCPGAPSRLSAGRSCWRVVVEYPHDGGVRHLELAPTHSTSPPALARRYRVFVAPDGTGSIHPGYKATMYFMLFAVLMFSLGVGMTATRIERHRETSRP